MLDEIKTPESEFLDQEPKGSSIRPVVFSLTEASSAGGATRDHLRADSFAGFEGRHAETTEDKFGLEHF